MKIGMASLLGVFACAGVLAAESPNQSSPAADQKAEPAAAAPVQPPRMVVRVHNAPAADTRDARVAVAGGFKISMPPSAGSSASGHAGRDQTSPVRTDGAIEIPGNTIGPGEALWQRNARLDAETRQAKADADYAERIAQQPLYDEHGRGGYWGSGGYIHSGTHQRWHRRGPWRPHAGVAPNTPTYDDLGARAQREFSDAAYPRLGAIEDGRANAVIEFGKAATPQIAPIQNAIDQGQINARKDLFSPLPQPEPKPPARPRPVRTR